MNGHAWKKIYGSARLTLSRCDRCGLKKEEPSRDPGAIWYVWPSGKRKRFEFSEPACERETP